MPQLFTRVISAVIAILILVGAFYFAGTKGLIALSILIATFAIPEYSRIALRPQNPPRSVELLFFIATFILLLATLFTDQGLVIGASVLAIFISSLLWVLRNRRSNEQILALLVSSSLGFIYAGSFPALVIKTLHTEGVGAFFTLLAMVFGGDILAYFGGILFGKRKIMVNVSPKKTWAGSICGALGSVGAGLICHTFVFSSMPAWYLAALSLLIAFVAQSGDLFVSLVKRVADVKDSGNIMPGHGGLLDRLDGVYFAAPVFYAFIQWSYTLF